MVAVKKYLNLIVDFSKILVNGDIISNQANDYNKIK